MLALLLTMGSAVALPIYGAVSIQGSEFNVVTSTEVQSVSDFLIFLGQRQFSAAAWGKFDDTINTTGWATLEIHSNASETDDSQAYGAGVLESSLTLERTEEFLTNVVKSNSSDYWKMVGLSYRQLQGMYDGYAHAATQLNHSVVSWDMYYTMTLEGDLDDLCTAFKCDGMAQTRAKKGHCSVLIKLTTDDLYMGHTTWSSFETMTRIYKLMNLQFSSVPVAAKTVAFSSYPGTIVSVDDWYQTDAGLVITETTIANNNQSLYDYVVPHTVLYWARNMVANRMASTGAQWVSTFLEHNSGTYNNQWMVLDSKRLGSPFSSSSPQQGLLTVAEQFPGIYTHTEDMTSYLLNTSYWMSFNVPFFPSMFNISDQWDLVKKYGDAFTWANCSRAQLFRSLQAGVTDESSFQKAMRHNDFLRDAVGTMGCKHGDRSASNAIAERGDLTPKDSDCLDDFAAQDEVAIDCKFTTAKRLASSQLQSVAQSGPSFDTQPVFVWSQAPHFINKISHIGHPDKFDFPWREFTWA